MNRSKDWLEQAELDLKHAEISVQNQDYNWACFAAQQSAEKAIKALYMSKNMEGWGHVIRALLKELKSEIDIPQEIIEMGMKLDQYYILTRYPNGFDFGKPADFYSEKQAEEAVNFGKKIIEFCKEKGSS